MPTSPEPIARDAVMPLLLIAAPGYAPSWTAVQSDPTFDPDLLYVHLGDFARYVLQLVRDNPSHPELGEIARAVERLHLEGDAHVREAATIGLLEALQNNGEDDPASLSLVEDALGPVSRRWWESLKAFWDGKIPHVGADIGPHHRSRS